MMITPDIYDPACRRRPSNPSPDAFMLRCSKRQTQQTRKTPQAAKPEQFAFILRTGSRWRWLLAHFCAHITSLSDTYPPPPPRRFILIFRWKTNNNNKKLTSHFVSAVNICVGLWISLCRIRGCVLLPCRAVPSCLPAPSRPRLFRHVLIKQRGETERRTACVDQERDSVR